MYTYIKICIYRDSHVFLQQRHITDQVLAVDAIAQTRHMIQVPLNVFENLPKDRYSLESGPQPTSTCH